MVVPSSASFTKEYPIIRSLVLSLGVLIALPAGFCFFVLSKSLQNQNLCHVGPVQVEPNSAVRDLGQWQEHRAKLLQMYGTYTTFDDASYYFVKTPYGIQPKCLPSFGWWSITTLSLTLLSPKLRQARQLHYRRSGNTYNIETSPAIQWDQSHRIKKASKHSSNQHSSANNRWCTVNTQDVEQYHQPASLRDPKKVKQTEYVFGEKALELVKSNLAPTKDLFRICAPSQPSILSNGNQAPYFMELPLQPPEAGIWKRYEIGINGESKNGATEFEPYDDDVGDDSTRTRFDQGPRPTSPFQLQVQCHVRDLELNHLAHGSLQPDSEPHLGWEHAEFIALPAWNLLELPGTILILLGLVVGNTWKNDKCTDKHWIRRWQQGWTHPTWSLCCWTLVWVYFMGACLEPLLGSLTLITIHVTLFLWVSLWKVSDYYIWVVFGFTVLLAQLLPELQMGPIQIFAVSFGESTNALKVNIFNVLIGTYPLISVSTSKINWKLGAGVVFMGWALSHTLCQEILAAPQWTVPTILMGDLWWKLQKFSKGIESKKTDKELEPIFEEDDEENEHDPDDKSRISSAFSLSSQPDNRTCRRIVRFGTAIAAYVFFALWFIVTLFCCMTFDWTLVIAHVMVLWMYIGSTTFPTHPLWSLYHMVAAALLLIFNVMTLVGWYLCHVAISTHALQALPSRYVWASLGVQTALHTIALVDTVCTKHWSTSPNVPGHYFWDHIKTVGDEIRIWFYIFG